MDVAAPWTDENGELWTLLLPFTVTILVPVNLPVRNSVYGCLYQGIIQAMYGPKYITNVIAKYGPRARIRKWLQQTRLASLSVHYNDYI